MVKIAIVQEYVPMYRQPFFEELIGLLDAYGIECRVFAGDPNKVQAKRNDGFESGFIRKVNQREYRVFGKRVVVSDVLSELAEFDMVIFEQARRNLALYRILARRVLINRSKSRRRQILALWGHGRDYATESGTLTRLLMAQLTNQVDWFFGYTKDSVDHVVGEGFESSRTTTVENSIDTKNLLADLQQIEQSVSECTDTTNLCYIGALDSSKNIPMVLKCAELVHRGDPQVRLTILGDGEASGDVAAYCAVREWASYRGHSTGKEKAAVLAKSELILNPGRIGLIALDSLTAGVPIATTDYGLHAPEYAYLDPGLTCAVFPNDDESYAQGVQELLSDKELLSRMQQNCMDQRGNYSIENMAKNFADGIRAALMIDQSSA